MWSGTSFPVSPPFRPSHPHSRPVPAQPQLFRDIRHQLRHPPAHRAADVHFRTRWRRFHLSRRACWSGPERGALAQRPHAQGYRLALSGNFWSLRSLLFQTLQKTLLLARLGPRRRGRRQGFARESEEPFQRQSGLLRGGIRRGRGRRRGELRGRREPGGSRARAGDRCWGELYRQLLWDAADDCWSLRVLDRNTFWNGLYWRSRLRLESWQRGRWRESCRDLDRLRCVPDLGEFLGLFGGGLSRSCTARSFFYSEFLFSSVLCFSTFISQTVRRRRRRSTRTRRRGRPATGNLCGSRSRGRRSSSARHAHRNRSADPGPVGVRGGGRKLGARYHGDWKACRLCDRHGRDYVREHQLCRGLGLGVVRRRRERAAAAVPRLLGLVRLRRVRHWPFLSGRRGVLLCDFRFLLCVGHTLRLCVLELLLRRKRANGALGLSVLHSAACYRAPESHTDRNEGLRAHVGRSGALLF